MVHADKLKRLRGQL